jgi:hypothetical protein
VPCIGTVHQKSRLLPALLLLQSACVPIPETVSDLPEASFVELDQTPFYPQERYQCGPAALTTLLAMTDADVRLEDIVDKVYLPGRRGSLQLELLAATRSSGRLPYVIDGTMAAIRKELWAGRPVLILQNLGVAAIPRWHYAVVVGIDTGRSEIFLRSGTDRRRVMQLDTFLRTWRRGDYWAMVVLRPDELPASMDRERYFAAISALEETGQLDAAEQAWQAAAVYWPDDSIVLFGRANVSLAQGNYATAEELYRKLLLQQRSLVAARNNLALALAEQGRFDEALAEIDVALADNVDPAIEGELQATKQTIREMRDGDGQGL